MHALKVFELISWISLPTVMYGGFALLGSVGDKLSPDQRGLFRAGHAHAGVLLVLSLVYEMYMSAAPLALAVKQVGCAVLLVGIILQAGGFFYRAFLGDAGKNLTRLGGLLLAAAIIVLVYGIIVGP